MTQPQNWGKLLILAGALLILTGALLYLAPRFPFLAKLLEPLRWRNGPVTVYFPLGLSILLSVLLSLLLYFWRRW
ncbi:MAG: DUF2905 family protein [Candidatus Zixiibacteriota bacterium]|nr:MAG: DUF2905 family protein [candidate division Zixibacteria bacterium]